MWETIQSVLTSSNAPIVLLTVVVIAIWLLILIKHGFISFNFKGVKVGREDKERTIIRQQVEWVKLYCDGMESRLPHPEGYNEWRSKYILECVFDEIITWITFNHITTNESYVEIKQNRIINLINSLTIKPEFQSKEFRDFIKDEIRFVITKLVKIREVYQSMN